MLVVMVNNRAYNNDWVHQRTMATERGNPQEKTGIGITIDDPAPDFAALAGSFGWHAQGPVHRPNEIGPAIAAAIEVIRTTGQPALVDIVCRPDES
jgi:acetolactate synthase-1/2/3 large subunit